MKKPNKVLMVAGSVVLAACAGSAGPDPEGALPAGHPTMSAPSLTELEERAATPSEGVVRETLAGGGYTYALLAVDGGEIWVAGPETVLEPGQSVSLAGAMRMGAFESQSLGRTFEELYFIGGFSTGGPPPDGTRGTALAVLAGGGYTYVQVRVAEDTLWLAGPEAQLAEGQTVVWSGGVDMGRFHSPSLDRTFSSILFVDRIWVEP